MVIDCLEVIINMRIEYKGLFLYKGWNGFSVDCCYLWIVGIFKYYY